MKSGEFALLPAPLSVSSQNVPSGMRLIPECPCRGCPLNGKATPVGRPADCPSMLPGASMRRPVVCLPALIRSAGTAAGASMKLWAGSTAWPASVAGNAVWAWEIPAVSAQAMVAACNRKRGRYIGIRVLSQTGWIKQGSLGLVSGKARCAAHPACRV